MNKMGIGKDGKTSELRRTGRRWRRSQFGQKVWFGESGEDGVSSFASRMTQSTFVSHPGTVLRINKNGFVRGISWTRQPLNDAWDAANWDGLCVTPWQNDGS